MNIIKLILNLAFSGLIVSCSCSYKREKIKVVSVPFSDEWKFQSGEGNDSLWMELAYNDSAWATVSSKKPFTDQGQATENGFGWYRKSLVLSDSLKNAIAEAGAYVLKLGRFASADEVYWNGKLVGKTSEFPPDYKGYSDQGRSYFVKTDAVSLEAENLLAIKFHDGWGAGGFLDESVLTIASAGTNDKLRLNVAVNDTDYIFLGDEPLSIAVSLQNLNTFEINGTLHVKITTDAYAAVKADSVAITIDGSAIYEQEFTFQNPEPGFYRYTVTFERNGETAAEQQFNLGYEPENIESPIDAKADFKAFWDNNLKELAKVAPEYKLTLQPEFSKLDYDMYLVEMFSFENELIRGYYGKPKRDGKFPVIVEYMGYGSGPYPPTQTWDGFAHFVLSIRGQALNQPTNHYGTWITSGVDSKEHYYYRGAFMDVIRAVDFVCSRPEIDADRIAVHGSSQGGALSFASAALDKRVKVAAPGIPFLSDYPDYFKIAPWPKSDFDSYMKEHPDANWEDIYDVLSYFDIKNLAQWITCPLYMGMGVQDNVCPPHINFAAYNQVQSEKRWMACPDYGHSTSEAYWNASMKFIREKLYVD